MKTNHTYNNVVAQDQILANVDSDESQDELQRKTELAGSRLTRRLEKYPGIPVVSASGSELLTRGRWFDDYDRGVLPKQITRAILLWEHWKRVGSATPHPDSGELVWEFRRRMVVDPLYIFAIEQTKVVKKEPRTKAMEAYWKLFGKPSHPDFRVPYLPGIGPKTWRGKITKDELKEHLCGTAEFALRMGKKTRLMGIDLDLHGGNFEVFSRQLRVLLDTFWGAATWHIQVKENHANGIHLLFITKKLEETADVAAKFRSVLCDLDVKHPELAELALSCGMNTFATVEIKPTESEALRAPLALGRTMLLDGPLTMVNYRGKLVQDVVGYIEWINKSLSGTATHMPKEEVYQYVISRLSSGKIREDEEETPIIIPPRNSTLRKQQDESGKTTTKPRRTGMKNRSWALLTEAWSGNMEADSLNHWIRQISLYAPFRFPMEELAVQAIETFIDELPCHVFSDRLIAGERQKVTAVVRRDVELAFAGWPDQPDPEKSAAKLNAVWQRWSSTGRDPFDKETWNITSKQIGLESVELAPDFDWTEKEITQLEFIGRKLNASAEQAADAVKYLARLIKVHPEVPRTWIVQLLEQHGIKAKSKKLDKPKVLIETLIELEWIWIPRKHFKGRCRRFALGTLREKFSGMLIEAEQDNCTDEFTSWSERVRQLERRVAEMKPMLFAGSS